MIPLLVVALLSLQAGGEELWEREMGEEMKIGPTTEGYERVELVCGAEAMRVSVHMEEPFDGVVYTRGWYRKPAPCFLDPQPPGPTTLTLNIPFNNCSTTNKSNIYENVLIVQHDDDLIMPGDAAFTLQCDFSKDKNYVLTYTPNMVVSKIELADADPGAKRTSKPLPQVSNQSDTVSFLANSVRLQDEL